MSSKRKPITEEELQATKKRYIKREGVVYQILVWLWISRVWIREAPKTFMGYVITSQDFNPYNPLSYIVVAALVTISILIALLNQLAELPAQLKDLFKKHNHN
jgi:hypothetical protein